MGGSSWKLEFPYRRSLGPVIGAFFTGLRDGKVLGSRTKEGRVLCPPLEYDPETGEAVGDDLVELSDTGVVRTFSWVDDPAPKHPLDRPFAWALVQVDGADTTFFHALDAPKESISNGMKVKVRWKGERQGHITDIECFEPE
jgi:uncharacterized protein